MPIQHRAMADMPLLLHAGAKEIAVLTAVAKEQSFAFKPTMEALEYLETHDAEIDWSAGFMVAYQPEAFAGHVLFDWRKAPTCRYASFRDFYTRELEPVWGEWDQLRATYAKVLSGEISDAEGQRRVLGAREIGIEGGKAGPGRGHKTAGNTKRFNGMDREYIAARLDRDGHTKLAAEVRAKTISANAAALQVGYRKKPTPLEIIRKQLPKLTNAERQELIHELTRGSV